MSKSNKSEKEKALKKAFDLLARRGHSRAELSGKLHAKGFSSQDIEAALDKCEQLGFLNDREFARFYIEELQRKGYGRFRLREKLQRRGFSRELIDELLAGCSAEHELELARAAGVKKLARLRGERDSIKRRQKLYRYLISRGFAGDTVQRLLQELTEESGSEPFSTGS